MRILLITTYLLTSFLYNVYNQERFIPLSISYQLNPIDSYIEFKPNDSLNITLKTLKNKGLILKTQQFAFKYTTELNPYNSGNWEITSGGHKVWRVGITSENAYSIYLVLQNAKLEKGVTLFVYNPSYSNISKPISQSSNNINKTIPIAPIPGDQIIFEMDLEPGVNNFGNFIIGEIWHDFKNIFERTYLKSDNISNSGSCNVNINCSPGAKWQNEKRAVCKLIANGELCTGTLINNVLYDKTPYLITAYHCIEDAKIAASAIFFFNHEATYCEAPDFDESQTIEGGLLVATTNHQLDFSLIRLNKFPPVSYRAYLAGWDATLTNTNSVINGGGTCIHHPWGETKKIAVENDQITTGNFGENFNDYSQWQIHNWDIGTTEPGSSGSAIFDSKHRVFGTLTGGEATCENPVNDYFTKFALDFDFYSENNKQLKNWLDPNNSGTRIIDGLDPYGFTDENSDTFFNYSPQTNFILSADTLKSGYVSGYNSENFQAYAEKFIINDTLLIPAIVARIALSKSEEFFSMVDFKIWKGNEYPKTEIYSKTVLLNSLKNSSDNIIYIDSTLILSDTIFIGYSLNQPFMNDSLALYSTNEGNNGFWVKKDNNWFNINNLTFNKNYSSLSVGYIGCKNLTINFKDYPQVLLPNYFGIFSPNPCSDFFCLGTNELATTIKAECYDVLGRKFNLPYQFNYFNTKFITSQLNPGNYFVRITINNRLYKGHIIVSKEL